MQHNDKITTFQELKDIVKKVSTERDWHQFHSPKNIAINISLEANELLEKFVWITTEESYDKVKEKWQEVADELSDVLYSILMFADTTGIDLSSAFIKKVEEIKAKYPIEKCKGTTLKYNELS